MIVRNRPLSEGTLDSTQEPENAGHSIVVLSSIQSGYSYFTGAKCNLAGGYYTDEEISLTAPGIMDWIREEINLLPGQLQIYK